MHWVSSPYFCQQFQAKQFKLSFSGQLARSFETRLDPIIDGSWIEKFLWTYFWLYEGFEQEKYKFNVCELVAAGYFFEFDGEDLCYVVPWKFKNEADYVLVEFGVSAQSEHGCWQSSGISDEPVIGERQHIFVGQLMCNSAENSTGPLRYFFAFWEQGRLDDLEEEKAHIILFPHFMHDKIDSSVPFFHELLNITEGSFDALDQDVGEVLVVVLEKSHCLLPTDVDAAH